MPEYPPIPSIARAGDQLGRRIARHLEQIFRQVFTGEQVTAGERSIRLVTGQPHPFGNIVVFSESIDAGGIEAGLEPLCRLQVPSMAVFVGQNPAGGDAVLAARGFQAHAPMPAMAVDLDRLSPTSLPAEAELIRVGAGPQGDQWVEVLANGYGLPRPVAALFSPDRVGADEAADAPLQFFLVMHRGRAVATSLLWLKDGLAGIYCVATLPDARGQGFGAHVTAEALRRARALGYGVGVLQASEPGYPVYRRLGFSDHGRLALHVRVPPAAG